MAKEKSIIGKILLDQGIISQQQLDIALAEQRSSNKKLGQILIDLRFIDESYLIKLLSKQMQLPSIDLKNYSIDADAMHLLSESDARRLHALVLNKDEYGLLVGMVDPSDVLGYDELERLLQQSIHIAIISQSNLDRAIDVNYRHKLEISSLSEQLSVEIGDSNYDMDQLAISSSQEDAPVVRLLQSIFEDAAQVGASDVHIEPDEHVLRLRLRIDGMLHEQILQQTKISSALSLRLKLMAGLKIAETRIPQDGRFSIKIKDKKFDVRLSSMPSQYGESVVMRLLNQTNELLTLRQMGMPKNMLIELRKIIAQPHGLLLITGPTGSGKSTSLYAMLSELNTPDVKIITVEDPVEYRLSRITQVQVQPIIDLTFSRILRSVLRQDPDIIMIGELRDQETAEIALRAAMTGHFVFSTLHTNDAVSTAERLIDMGVESYLVASVLHAVISQRLVRRICQNCIDEDGLSIQEKSWLSSIKYSNTANIAFKKGKGCTFCYQTGYKGQIGVFELLVMTRDLMDALRRKNNVEFMQLIEEDSHFKPLVLHAMDLATQGITTVEEVMRITGEVFYETNKIDGALTS
jgi:MSHA biogenesis protein MshE